LTPGYNHGFAADDLRRNLQGWLAINLLGMCDFGEAAGAIFKQCKQPAYADQLDMNRTTLMRGSNGGSGAAREQGAVV
jgi:hypothetical protein